MPAYLKYGEIRGEVKEPAHKSWIELTSVQLGAHRPKSWGSRERDPGAPDVSEIVVNKDQDSTSVLLFQESLTGKSVEATIDFVKEGVVYLRVTMKGTLISSYQFGGTGDRPAESLTLNFEKVEFEQNPSEPPPKFK